MAAPGHRNLDDYRLALLSRAVFDVGPRTRRLMLVAGIFGIVFAIAGSLAGDRSGVPLDKLIHFTGYTILAATLVLALRPVWFLLGLAGLAAMSVGIEFIQPFFGRQFEWSDMAVNGAAIACGGLAGLAVRSVYAYLKRELAARSVRRHLLRFPAGAVILRAGEPAEAFYIIRSGRVRASRRLEDGRTVSVELGPGEVIGLLGVLGDGRQYAAVEALEPTELYRMTLGELMESAGGEELPVALVLRALSAAVRRLVEHPPAVRR